MATEQPQVFPEANEEFKIRSKPIFLLSYNGDTEVVVLNAEMTVRTAAPQTNRRGKRAVDVDVAEWIATGRSELLNQDISLRLEGDQPRSYVTARTFEGDFPATLRFRMNWAVEAAGNRIDGLESQAVGTINAFPPRPNDRFEMIAKDVQVADVTLEGLMCAC